MSDTTVIRKQRDVHEGHEDEVERELHERNLQYFIQHSTVAELSRYREEIIQSFSH